MKKSIYRQFTIAALALIMAFSNLPLAAKPAAAAQAGPPMFQDDFEGTNAAAWTIGSGTWVTEEGNNEPLFSDDFENGNAAKWTNNGGSWSAVQNGTSTSYGQSAGGASELIAGDASWTNYVYEADVKLVNGAGAMMDFRYQDSLHFYYLYMSETYIRLMKQNGSDQDWISAYDGPSLQTSATVRIKVEAIGNQFKIYRDGELVLSTADNADPYLSGKIGLATWATSVEYDNVSVLNTTANHVFVQSDDNGGEAVSGELSWSNYSVQTRLALSSLNSDGSAGIRLRQQDSGDGYDMRYLSDSDGGKLQILKRINGEETIVAEAPFSMQTGRFYVWKGVAAGKYLDLYIDGNKYLSVADSTYTTGKIALMLLNATASYDNVIVEQVSVPVISDGNTTFYVSSSMGDDNNDGLSEATAWRTLEKANEAEFHAGDNLLLKSGDRWNEPLILQGSGTAEYPIRVSAYGTGDKPVIAWNAPHGGSVLSGRNLSNWVIQGLALQIIPSSTQSWSNITAGIQLYYDNSNGHGNVLIDGNDVYSSTYDSNTNGIVISASVPGTDNKEVARDLTISNNTVHDIGWYAITTTGWDTEKNEELRSQLMYGNVKVSGNEVYNTASQGIVVQNAHNSVIERNVVHDGGLGTDTWGPGGLWFIASRDSVIKFNEIYNMKDADSGFDGAGLNIDWYCDNITVQYNYSHDNKGNGITTMSNYGTKIVNNKVKGNKAQQSNGNGQIALGNFTGRPDLSSGLHNVEVASNTILVDVDGTSAINSASNPYGTWTGITIHDNNVVIGQGMPDNEVFSIAPNTSISAIDGNRIYSDSSAFRSILHGTVYTGLALWQAGTGYDLNSQALPQDQTAPSSVSNVAAASDGYVQLTWELAEDQGSGIAHYNVYRSVTPQFELTYANMVGESASASFEDREDVQVNTTYYYRVEAEDRNGNVGLASDTIGITTGATVPAPEQPKLVDFMAPRDQDIVSLASLIAKPYLSGIPNVRSVQLFVDDRLAQESDSYPYAFLLEGLKNGKHRLQYKVHDTNGGVTESAPITIDKQVVALRSLYATTAPAIDGDLSDWDAADFRMDQRSQVKNIDSAFSDNWTPQKLKAAGNTRWDDTNLYVAVSVTEDEHHLSITNAADLWKGSSIQIAIDPDRGSAPGSKGYTEFAFGLTDDGSALAYRYHAIDGKVAGAYASGQLSIVRNESTKLTDYEIAIPWSEIIPSGTPIGDGSSLGISVLVNYSDGTHVNPASGDARNGWIEYNSGIGAGKAPRIIRLFITRPPASYGACDRRNRDAGRQSILAMARGRRRNRLYAEIRHGQRHLHPYTRTRQLDSRRD
ncbi:right-handed parallel beta-helix repeat-containing protein [Cohnella rhizosphaerae]|uniref:Right-handed parallel beta-helix repeat-containing protein n=1 Tax=Cohnella rhizosphaerae TaxID=1457232 RepID=A0A9X4QVB4_9BACL|nr:right-handed parallel beta-helix repeat-containing protein [Cohnella rhizosphaerae]MDG0812263.1 right-handed parallel beta-helix repeat-containing protein [Cohnella rhizosphaerae]